MTEHLRPQRLRLIKQTSHCLCNRYGHNPPKKGRSEAKRLLETVLQTDGGNCPALHRRLYFARGRQTRPITAASRRPAPNCSSRPSASALNAHRPWWPAICPSTSGPRFSALSGSPEPSWTASLTASTSWRGTATATATSKVAANEISRQAAPAPTPPRRTRIGRRRTLPLRSRAFPPLIIAA